MSSPTVAAAGNMDAPERLVLRRKKLLLATNFDLAVEHLNKFRDASLIKKSDYDFIKGEPHNIGRVGRLVDAMPLEGFEFLCQLLEEHNEWLSDELRAELKAELGQLEVEEYIIKEASVIVHREFGASKRLAEGDKAKLCTLLALRTQFAKEVWKKQLSRTEEALQESKDENSEKDTRAELLLKKIGDFLKINGHRMKRTRPPSGSNYRENQEEEERKQQEEEQKEQEKPPSKTGKHLEVKESKGRSPRPESKASDIKSRKRGTPSPHKDDERGSVATHDGSSTKNKSGATSKGGDGTLHPPSPGPIKDPENSNQGHVSPRGNHSAQTAVTSNVCITVETMKLFDELQNLIEELLTLSDECTKEKEQLRVERLRLLEALRVKPGDSELVQMDVRLKGLLQEAQEAVDVTTCKIKERDAQNKELDHKLTELFIESEKVLEVKDEEITQLTKQLKETQDKNRDLQLNCMKMEADTRAAKNEFKQYKQKTASLERNRRLGYKPAGECRQGSGSRFPAIQQS